MSLLQRLNQRPQNGGATAKEKEEWERELLGVSLSESVISQVHRSIPTGMVTMCRDVTPEMGEQRVSLIGEVFSVRQGYTRKGDPFWGRRTSRYGWKCGGGGLE